MADTLKLTIEVDDNGSAVLKDFKGQITDMGVGVEKSSKQAQTAFSSFRSDVNQAFTFSAGQLIADGIRSAGQAVIGFGKESIDTFLEVEAAMTGVAKTTGLPKQEIEALNETLRDAAAAIGPIATVDLAQIAEVAGQIGIAGEKIKSGDFKGAREEIAGFAKVIGEAAVALPEFTGGAEEIATATGKILNLYQLGTESTEKVLSVANTLANTTAADAKEIFSFLQGFTSANTLGIANEQAQALGATFISLGQDPHDAATRFQTALTNLNSKGLGDAAEIITKSQTAIEGLAKISGAAAETLDSEEAVTKALVDAMNKDIVGAALLVTKTIGEMDSTTSKLDAAKEIFGQVGARAMMTMSENTKIYETNLGNALQASKEASSALSSIHEEFLTAIDTQGAQFATLNSQITATKEVIGKELVDALAGVAKTDLTPAVEQFRNWLQTSEESKVFFETTLPGAIKMTMGAIEGAFKVLGAFNNAIIAMATAAGTAIDKLTSYETDLQEEIQETAKVTGEYAAIQAQQMTTMSEYTNVVGWMIEPLSQAASATEDAASATETLGAVTQDTIAAIDWSSALDSLNEIGRANREMLAGNQQLGDSFQSVFMELHQGVSQGIEPSGQLVGKMLNLVDAVKAAGGETTGFNTVMAQAKQAVLGVDDALEGHSLTPAMYRYVAAAEASGKETSLLSAKYIELKRQIEFAESQSESFSFGLNTLRQHEEELAAATAQTAADFQKAYAEDMVYGLNTLRDAYQETYEEAEYPESALLSLRASVGVIEQAEAATIDWGAAFGELEGNLGTLSGSLGALGDLFNIDTSGITSVLGTLQGFAQLPGILSDVGGSISGLMGSLGGLLGEGGLGGLNDALGGVAQSAGGLSAAMGPMAIGMALGPIVGDLASSLFGLDEATAQTTQSLMKLHPAIGLVYAAFQGLFAETQSEGTKAAEKFKGMVKSQISDGDRLSTALSQAFDDMSAAGFDYVKFLDAADPATRDLHASLGGLDGELGTFADAIGKASGSQEKGNQITLQMVAAMAELGYTGAEARAKLAEIAATVGETGDTTALSTKDMEALKQAIIDIPEKKEVHVTVVADEVPKLAYGGEIGAAGLAVVGDRFGPEIAKYPSGAFGMVGLDGPELRAFPVGTQIIPNNRIGSFLRDNPGIPAFATGGTVSAMPGGVVVNIGTLAVQGDIRQPAEMRRLATELSREIARQVRGAL